MPDRLGSIVDRAKAPRMRRGWRRRHYPSTFRFPFATHAVETVRQRQAASTITPTYPVSPPGTLSSSGHFHPFLGHRALAIAQTPSRPRRKGHEFPCQREEVLQGSMSSLAAAAPFGQSACVPPGNSPAPGGRRRPTTKAHTMLATYLLLNLKNLIRKESQNVQAIFLQRAQPSE